MGIGGDLSQVKDGVAELRIVEVPSTKEADQHATLTKDPGMKKIVVNTPLTVAAPADPANPKTEKLKPYVGLAPPLKIDPAEVKPTAGVKIVRGTIIAGQGIEYVKGHPGVARLKVQDGLWEQRRGHKVDGGERRRAEVRFKRRAAERKNAR